MHNEKHNKNNIIYVTHMLTLFFSVSLTKKSLCFSLWVVCHVVFEQQGLMGEVTFATYLPTMERRVHKWMHYRRGAVREMRMLQAVHDAPHCVQVRANHNSIKKVF